MLVTVEPLDSPDVVRVHAPVGTAVVGWRGTSAPLGGPCHVEWDIDVDLAWGRNAHACDGPSAELREDGEDVVFRGLLSLGGGGAVLDVGGAAVLLDLGAAPPSEAPRWIEFRVPAARVTVWPYEL